MAGAACVERDGDAEDVRETERVGDAEGVLRVDKEGRLNSLRRLGS